MRVLSREKLDEMEAYLRRYAHDNNGDMPALPELAEKMGMYKSTAYRYLLKLREEGKIDYDGKGTLGLRESSGYTKKAVSVRVPIYGSVICGTPEEEEQHSEGYLAIPEEWTGGECFLLRARGDSMKDAGVDAGDLVLVRRAGDAQDGRMVVALTEEGNTLKRLGRENGKPVLLAENRTYPEERRVIRPRTLEIQGVAVKIIKDVK